MAEENPDKSAAESLFAVSLAPAFAGAPLSVASDLRWTMEQAVRSWLLRTPSPHTRTNYERDLRQFLTFMQLGRHEVEMLTTIRPGQVAAWRDDLSDAGSANATIRRKLTTLRSLFSYLQVYGYTGANPAHGRFVQAPPVPRDGKTVALSPTDCRRLLEAPDPVTPAGIRDRAIFAVLAYSACRVGELVKLKVGDFKTTGEHRVLSIYGKGGKERLVPLHLEAVERLSDWLQIGLLSEDRSAPLFRPTLTARGQGRDGFRTAALAVRTVECLLKRYAMRLRLDPAVTVHSLRVTALTTARERGSDIIDLQEFAGHADPRTTLTYIRSRDRLSKSPAYILKY